jgi:hypothetical protein
VPFWFLDTPFFPCYDDAQAVTKKKERIVKNFLKTALLLMFIPALALCVSVGIETKINSDMRAALREQYPDVPAEKIQAFTVQQFLAGQKDNAELASLRLEVGFFDAMKYASIAVLGFSALFMVLIKIFGLVSRNNRVLLLRLFKPSYN